MNFIRKGTTRAINIQAAAVCRKYGITIWANYMLGLPTETKEEIMDTVSMLKEIDPDYYSPAFYTPHPGSDLYDYCEEHDLSLIKTHDSYRRNPDELKIKGHDYEFLQLGAAGVYAAQAGQSASAHGRRLLEAVRFPGKGDSEAASSDSRRSKLKTIMVTGGAGFIGSNFARHILDTYPKYRVVVYDKLTYAGNMDNLRDLTTSRRFVFVKGDIADASEVTATLRDHRVDAIVNFAAESHVDRSILDPDAFIRTDVYGTYVLLEAARSSEDRAVSASVH